jgi:hypothetical protein
MTDTFDQFWKLYPRKIAKKHALQMWKRLTKAQQDKALGTIGNHIQQWAKELREDRFVPHAASWLNRWSFDDDLAPRKTMTYDAPTKSYQAPPPVEMTPEVRAKIEQARSILRR